jgi:hypothetical protein
MNYSKQINGLLCLLLVALITVLYGQFLWNPIVFDDMYFFLQDDQGNQPVSRYHFELLQLRSLPYATLAWTKAWFGLDLINFRVGNLLLHAAVVLSLFGFLARLFSVVLDDSRPETTSPQWIAFFAALLFAMHPVSTYAVGYLVQRTIVMATLFSLLALVVYVKGSTQQKPMWLWLSVPLYYLAVFSKEHAIMLPAVLVALTVLLHDDWQVKLKQRWGIWLALLVIAIIVVLSRKGLLGSVYEINAPEMLLETKLAYPLSVLTQAWLFFKYMFLWVVPNPAWMSIDMREPFAPAIFSRYLVAAVFFLAWGIGAIWLLLKRGLPGLAGFALLFPWLMFMTEFSSVRIQEVFVLYRSYLWVPGIFCLLPVMFYRLKGRSTVLLLAVIVLTMFPLSMDRLMTLSHPVLLWDDAEKLVKERLSLPGVDRIYYNRGTQLIHINKADAAIVDLKQAIALSPDFVEAHGNLGAAYIKNSDWQNAVTAFSQAIEIARRKGKTISPRYFHGRAQALEALGELEKSQADYRESCRLGKRACDKVVTTVQ